MTVRAAPEPSQTPQRDDPEDELAARLAAQVALAPPGLTQRGAALWASIAGEWELRPDELRLLSDACEEADLVDRLSRQIVEAPLVVSGSQGQPVAAPCVQELRQHRACLASLLGRLRLVPLDEDDGLTPELKSRAARAAARARWDRHGA